MKADKTTTLGAADAKKPKAKKGAKMTREERTAAHWRKKADDMEAVRTPALVVKMTRSYIMCIS